MTGCSERGRLEWALAALQGLGSPRQLAFICSWPEKGAASQSRVGRERPPSRETRLKVRIRAEVAGGLGIRKGREEGSMLDWS